MNPVGFHNPLDPFGGHGIPGDPMEAVLSLQTYSSDLEPIGVAKVTNGCFTNVCDADTNGCTTNVCSGSTNGCTTNSCDGKAEVGGAVAG